MRRALILINNTGIGGAERRFGRLFARMADADADTVFVINAGLWRRLRDGGVVSGRERRVWRFAEPCGWLAEGVGLRGAPAFWLRKLDYLLFGFLLLARYGLAPRSVFHLVLGGAYVAFPLMLLRPGHRTLISVVSTDLAQMVGVPAALLLYRRALGRCALIDALSEGIRADLVRRGIPGEKIVVSEGSAVDTARFQPALKKQPWVVFAGRLVEEKNPVLFVEAMPTILRAVPTARIFLLGEGPLRPMVEQALERSGVRDAVTTGFLPDLVPIFGPARVFVSLQRQDNYPSQSLLEAMASGAATVATDVGLTWKLVDETTGIRVKPNPDDIAGAVIALLKEPARCERLGQSARRLVMERHSEKGYRDYLESRYARLSA
ncbi:MAG: glycosyltransferase [Nitrospirae bacterium]|nr:MAG: glycosyltransferase [Nitrospirota bacterium]